MQLELSSQANPGDVKRALESRIVELARSWYRYGNEAELAAAVQEYEHMLKSPGGAE